MAHKSRIQKKRFGCGHMGFGEYCHLCEDVKNGKLVKTTRGKYIPPSKVSHGDIS